ncbi:thiol reductant ABC exporter subunit CydC [Streptosporangiaceae bacterium NEAU-GS5]|nr:thiol reductant ABC exporter subunit CydC [Streptosporangiaceae bacterium NEAU-GS5]
MWRRLGVAALAGAAADLAGLALIASAAWLITRAAQQPELAALSVAIVAVRAFATSRGLFRYGERLAGHDVALRAQAATRERLYEALIPIGPLPRRGADLLSRMVDDTEAVQDLLVRCLLPAVAAAATAAIAVVMAVFLLPMAAALLTVGLAVVGIALPLAAATSARRWSARIAPVRAELAARAADLAHGAVDLAAYGARDRAVEAAMAADARLSTLERGRARLNAAALGLGIVIQGLTVAAVTLIAGRAGLGSVATAVLALTSLVAFEPALPLAAAGERLASVRAALRRLAEIRATPPAIPTSDAQEPPEAPLPPKPHDPKTHDPKAKEHHLKARDLKVEVRDLVVRYAGSPSPALDGVSLTLTPGKRVAIVGPSGAGKSTLLAALMRTVDYESGNITISDETGVSVEAREIAPESVRRAMTGLTQDPYVFQASFRDNLRLAGPDASEDDLAEAVRRARLDAWAERTGWDTQLGEDGTTVSGGQLQRLALARALLYDPPILLLDEPAEALDEPTADALLADLLDATRDHTTLLVTHRLRGLERVDEIVVLEAGRVIQRGTHTDLVEHPGYYRDLWEAEALHRQT